MSCPRCEKELNAKEKLGYTDDGVTIIHWGCRKKTTQLNPSSGSRPNGK